MKKLFTLLVANMLIVGGVFAQDSENKDVVFAEHSPEKGMNSQVTRVSPSGKYITGQEDAVSGIMLLWDTENNDYQTVDFKGIGQVWHVSDNGTILGQANQLPVIFRVGDEEPTAVDTTGQAYGCTADETILVGIGDYGDGMFVTPKVWRQNGDKYDTEVLDFPNDNEKFENGAFAKGISEDGSIIWGCYAAYDYSLVVWRLNESGEYVIDNVAARVMAQNNEIAGIEPEHMSPNGKYITGICYSMSGEYVFRYDAENDKFELIAAPANENAAARGWDVANDGTIVSMNAPQMMLREPYIVRSGTDFMVPFGEWLSYSDIEIAEQIANSNSVTLSGISGDGKTIGGYYLGEGGYVSFFYHIPDLQLGVDEVTDNTVRDDEFCYVEEGQLYIPGGCDALYVYSIGGVQVFAAADGTATSYSLQSLPNGVYVVRAEKEGQNIVTKIIL